MYLFAEFSHGDTLGGITHLFRQEAHQNIPRNLTVVLDNVDESECVLHCAANPLCGAVLYELMAHGQHLGKCLLVYNK